MKSNLLDKEVHELLTINFERDFWDGLTDDPLGNIDQSGLEKIVKTSKKLILIGCGSSGQTRQYDPIEHYNVIMLLDKEIGKSQAFREKYRSMLEAGFQEKLRL